ncbi:hypothetical protein DRN98_09885, partial [Methanosarcinales archaeon]
MPLPQTPKEQFTSHQNEINHAVFQQMKTVDLFDVENYGAQYIHLRCGLMSPYTRLHLLRYLHRCGFGDGLLVRLYPYRTLTDKKLQALLGAL